MRSLRFVAGSIAVLMFVSMPVSGQQTGRAPASRADAAKNWTPPRTPWGHPDLQGIYTNKDESGIPMEKPDGLAAKGNEEIEDSEFAEIVKERNKQIAERAPLAGGITGAGPTHWYENYNARNSRLFLLVDPPGGKIPPETEEAKARAAARNEARARSGRGPADSWEDRSLYDRCISLSVPGSMTPKIYGNSYEIYQAPDYVAIRYEMVHETRIIPLDGRPHVGSAIRQYMGDARGRWEGNTLVVETTNFHPNVNNRGATENLRLIERFTAVAPDKVEWSVTYDDPKTWTKPWTFAMLLTKDPSQQIFEYACHEGNYGLRNILSAARAEEQAAFPSGKK
ncbi:MAG TPA: hypothetical protein VH701_27775 [Vicinamibacterales bacterium]